MHQRTNTAVLLVLLTATANGCASLPEPTGVTANGQPLSVQEQTHHYTYTTKERIGETVRRDSRGRNVGTTTLYADRKRAGSYTEWTGYQGGTAVSDDDLFRLAKDQAAVDEIKSSRESGVTLNRIGWVTTIAGMAATGTGIGLAVANKGNEEGRSFFDSPFTVALTFGGAALWAIGTYLVTAGASKAAAKHPLEQRRAEQAAERYNATLKVPDAAPPPEGEARQ